jgi:AcrR family transcriptional regulator
MADAAPLNRRTARLLATRERVAATAMQLFADRGFDQVTVSDVARSAGVTEKTVFNHFASKEDLVFDRDHTFEAALSAAVTERSPGTSVHAAVSGFLMARYRRLPVAPEAQARLARLARMIENSARLQTREREILQRYAATLTELISSDSNDPVIRMRAAVAAEALIAVHRAAVFEFRSAALAGGNPRQDGRRVVRAAQRSFDLLASGLADYGPATGPVRTPAD